MTTYMSLTNCQLLCSCKKTNPYHALYFCRHCLEIRCTECVSHEVDSHYCPNCLENMASAEAKMRKHRCGNCFDCPSCGHTLSTRATAVMLAKADDPGRTTAEKAYYLACGFCRWSTRDSGHPDQQQPAGGWQETPSPFFKTISKLIECYGQLAQQEKADKDWSKFVRKRNYMVLLDRYPVLNPRLRKYCSFSMSTPNRETEPAKKIEIPAAEASSELPPFDLDSFIKQPLCIDKITTIQQRLLAPQLQPETTDQLQPRPKGLIVKRSMRCRVCEHNLSRADFNPICIKFRINLSAIYHVPEIRFMLLPSIKKMGGEKSVPNLERRTSVNIAAMKAKGLLHEDFQPGQTMSIVLTIYNPAHRVTTVSLSQLTPKEEAEHLSHLCRPNPNKIPTKGSKPDVGSAGDTDSSDENLRPCFSTVKLNLPSGEFKLAPRNDLADYDDGLSQGAPGGTTDDPRIVAFRRANKLGLFTELTMLTDVSRKTSTLQPVKENIEEVPEVTETTRKVTLQAALRLNFDYKNTTTALLSEQRAAAAAAAAAAAGSTPGSTTSVKESAKELTGETESNKSTNTQIPDNAASDEVKQISLIVLLNFGDVILNK